MRALVFHAPEQVAIETVGDPALVEPGDAIVRVTVAGVCGSDLHVYHGRETGLDSGTILGHELVGVVEDVGGAVRSFRRGDVVLSPFSTSCAGCFYCRDGLTARCTRGQLFGWVERGRGLHGAQAEWVRVPLADTTLVPAPPDLDAAALLLAGDVLATGLYAAELGGVAPGKLVAVLGAGPVGLMAAVGAGEAGAERVFVVDSLAERLALAVRFGAEALDRATTDIVAAVRAASGGRGADVVIEAVGSPEATRLAYDLVRPGGVIAAPGVHTERHLAFSPVEAYDKNLTYRAGRCPARRLVGAALAILRRRGDLTWVISHRLPLEDGPRAYDLFARKLDRCTKVGLWPQGVPLP